MTKLVAFLVAVLAINMTAMGVQKIHSTSSCAERDLSTCDEKNPYYPAPGSNLTLPACTGAGDAEFPQSTWIASCNSTHALKFLSQGPNCSSKDQGQAYSEPLMVWQYNEPGLGLMTTTYCISDEPQPTPVPAPPVTYPPTPPPTPLPPAPPGATVQKLRSVSNCHRQTGFHPEAPVGNDTRDCEYDSEVALPLCRRFGGLDFPQSVLTVSCNETHVHEYLIWGVNCGSKDQGLESSYKLGVWQAYQVGVGKPPWDTYYKTRFCIHESPTQLDDPTYNIAMNMV